MWQRSPFYNSCASLRMSNKQFDVWKIQDGGCWHVRFVAFRDDFVQQTSLLAPIDLPKDLFSCKIHQGKIDKNCRVLVANLATNFWILVARAVILVALATVLGAISCPEIMCNPKRYVFLLWLPFLVRDRISILASLVSNREWFNLHSILVLDILFRQSYPALYKHINIAFMPSILVWTELGTNYNEVWNKLLIWGSGPGHSKPQLALIPD